MRFLLRKTSSSVSRSTGSWLTLLLLFVVLVPSVCLLWFLSQAVQNERLAGRQKLIDAYRAQLLGAQERLQAGWQRLGDELAAQSDTETAPALFARLVRAGVADAVVCFDSDGGIIYPDAPPPPRFSRPDPAWAAAQELEAQEPEAAAGRYAALAAQLTEDDLVARALQGQARSLARAGEREAALAVLTISLQEERFRHARDAQGRLLAPYADFMAFELLRETRPEEARGARERLLARLEDYESITMPATQRRFLMNELRRLAPEATASPLLAAENLAAAYLQAGDPPDREPALQASGLPGVWQQAAPGGRVLSLHRAEKLPERLHAVVGPEGLPADVRLVFLEPGREAEGILLSIPAGTALPGWRLALAMQDPLFFESAASARVTSYIWIAVLVVIAVVVLALLAWGLLRRQVALTQLRNDLVANVTHELKTPLASMRLLVDTLLETPRLHEPTAREYLQLIATENLRLSRLIDNFLTFSRIERNKYTFDFQSVPPRVIAENAAAAVRERLQADGCRFDIAIASDLPPVTADSGAMVTALINLLDNAWKYSGDAKHIALTAGADNGSVCFAVRDNGIGLSSRDTRRIFRRYIQAHAARATSAGGVGLGLSIVQFIVSAHQGDVRVESEPGRGSTFTITLPAAGHHERTAKQ